MRGAAGCARCWALVAAAACLASAQQEQQNAVLTVDKTTFLETFGQVHAKDWANSAAGGEALVVVLEQILGGKLDAPSRAVCDEVFDQVSAKWRGNSVRAPTEIVAVSSC